MFRRILRKKYRRAVGTHYGPTRTRRAGFSLFHRRGGRAGTTILQMSPHPTTGPRHFSVTTPAGLLEQGQRRSIRRSRRTVLRDYGPEEAASSRHRAVGSTTGPFQGPRADREQRTPPSTPQGPQYLPRNYGPDGSAGWLCRSTSRQADDTTTRPSGSGPTSQSDAGILGQSFFTPIDRQGLGRVAK